MMTLVAVAAVFIVAVWALTLALTLPLWIPGVLTSLVAMLFAARFALNVYRGARAEREIQRSLAQQAAQFEKRARPDQQAEARALAVQFDEALQTLKSSKLAHGSGGALYTLPWYVIIGPPGAGKSTAIRQSGLQFPLLGSKGSIRGIGGTRNCDWWLTNEAVLLDTAGRYATEDDDRDEWHAFLDMLRRARPKRPLNGLIVAVSIAELAMASDHDLSRLAERIRERLDEVMQKLEVRLPVYTVFTKCDLIPGFIESFEDLRKSERGQVLGFTLPAAERGDLAERVDEQWTRLVQVAERRSLLRLADTRGTEGRRAVYEFPQQLESLKDNVASFLTQAFVDNVYRDAPWVRGVYLTSGTQEGRLVDKITGAMAAAFGLPPADESAPARTDSKSYFLADLFRTVMFPDQRLAAKSIVAVQRARVARAIAAGALALLALVSSAIAARAYAANREVIRGAQRELAMAVDHRDMGAGESSSLGGPKPISLSALEPIRMRLRALSEWSAQGAPWGYRAGLYQGDAVLPRLRAFYTSTLRAVLVQPLVEQTEAEIGQMLQLKGGLRQAPTVGDHAWLYEKTRVYLLLTQPKQAGEPPLDAPMSAWLTDKLVQAWVAHEGSKASPAERQAMSEHVAAYLALLSSEPKLGFVRSGAVVGGARELLARVPMVKLAVDRIVAEVESRGWDLSLDNLLGGTGLPLSASGRVRGAFTRRAWDEQLRALFQSVPPELLGDAWVLESREQDKRSEQARTCAIRSEYFGRFADEWRAFIGTLRVEEPADHGRAVVVLQDLTRGQPPPLERVMRAIAYNARLGEPAADKDVVQEKAEQLGVVAQLKKRVQGKAVAQFLDSKDPCAGGDYLTEQSVRRALEGFFSFGASWEEAAAGAPAPLTAAQTYQEQLTYIRDALQAHHDDPSSADALLARLASARTRVRSLIETQQIGWRPRFDALLWPPVNGSSLSSSAALAGEKGLQWCSSVVLPFARTLRGHYPFSKQGQDAALADLADFYRPASGILWGFYDAALKRDVHQVGGGFEIAQGAGVGSMYTPELVRFLDRAQYLSSVLFPPRADKPRVDFEVRVRPSPGIAQVLLTIDGQQIDFHNGPERWHRVSWPGEGDKPGASMRVKGAHIDETLGQDGEWGLFRLLDKGTIFANAGERFFTARWRLHTQNDVTIDIRPARLENPFVGPKAYLEAFRADGVQVPASIAANGKACVE